MCIAIAKKIGVELPSEAILKNCFDNNDDGAGFAFAYNGTVYIRKGHMTFDAFMNDLRYCEKRYDLKECGMLMHFRIATHGGVCKEMTHPFPLISDTAALGKPLMACSYAIVHNGIISLTSDVAHKEHGVSDTAVFVRDYLSLIAQNRQWFKRKANIELIEKLIGSKMAILNNRGEIINTSGFVEDNGVLYSNTTYKTARVTRSYYGGEYYGSYGSSYSSYSSKSSKDKQYCGSCGSTPLMRCIKGDTVITDSIEEYINSEKNCMYYISQDGCVYYRVEENVDYDGYEDYASYSDYLASYEFVGMGSFIDRNNKPRSFVCSTTAYNDQFFGDECPANIMKSAVADDDIDRKDRQESLNAAFAEYDKKKEQTKEVEENSQSLKDMAEEILKKEEKN